ncbi:DegT/DnrJ/EryC1/StrS family aminotransferase [Planctomicrobium piriforme]|uniref:dTDP-4-amino-4,6-dideoxygalactose transaminase n=1 Tax=Planctomicrobium piriforme TaxID=1576369 RepID=A0A1I3C576_9PLAN|nr:DegT/DnrJ/EryC1/StrS family aminotransferase [Planctomicrobium piriforme]SFH69309.1 dTDP-4-amino-4,6-dideoxygalactose transaminase [Planctomicrobium piriforme]
MNNPIPIAKVDIGPAEREAVLAVLESGWLVQGPQVAAFERRVAELCKAPHAIAVTSGTSALYLALKALGVGPGDEVIVPAFTWVATANSVELCGATAVFCDIDLATFNVTAEAVAQCITERTVGIVPVHQFGLMADMPALKQLADARGLWLMEDAACALGGQRDGVLPGQLSRAACFSFHPRKSITTGEGGMIVTNDDALAAHCRSLRNHGASVTSAQRHGAKNSFLVTEFDQVALNFRLTDLQAALGVAQLSRFDHFLAERHRCAAFYDSALGDHNWLHTPVVPNRCEHPYQSYVCLFAPEELTLRNLPRLEEQRNALLADLESQGIATRQGTHAPVRLPVYQTPRNIRPEEFPNAWMAHGLSIALPLYSGLSASDMQRVADALSAAFHKTAQPLRRAS